MAGWGLTSVFWSSLASCLAGHSTITASMVLTVGTLVFLNVEVDGIALLHLAQLVLLVCSSRRIAGLLL